MSPSPVSPLWNLGMRNRCEDDFLVSVNDLDGEVPMQPTISDSIQSRTHEEVKQLKPCNHANVDRRGA